MKPVIASMALSVSVADKDYGNGSDAFFNMTASYPGEGLPFDQLDQAPLDALDMFLRLWTGITAQRWSAGIITGEEFKTRMAVLEKRFNRVKQLLSTDDKS
jgi:hypothetical protein